MKSPRFTIGILGFLALVFCVDTAISDAQIFRRRLCPPCLQHRQCAPCWHSHNRSCLQSFECFSDCEICGLCGGCEVRWDSINNRWYEHSACVPSSCPCPIPIVAGTDPIAAAETCEAHTSSELVFYLDVSTSNTGLNAQKKFSFKVPSAGNDISMNKFRIITKDGTSTDEYWEVVINYLDSENPVFPPEHEDPWPTTFPRLQRDWVKVTFQSGSEMLGFTSNEPENGGNQTSMTGWVRGGKFKVTITKVFN